MPRDEVTSWKIPAIPLVGYVNSRAVAYEVLGHCPDCQDSSNSPKPLSSQAATTTRSNQGAHINDVNQEKDEWAYVCTQTTILVYHDDDDDDDGGEKEEQKEQGGTEV